MYQSIFPYAALPALFALVLLFLTTAGRAEAAAGEDKELVILDADMVELYDDGAAMLMLASAPNIKLLGVCTTAGNTWAAAGAAYALRQLEAAGLADEIPVFIGEDETSRKGRAADIERERALFGVGRDRWQGAFGGAKPASWRAAYRAAYGVEPHHAPAPQSAADFIIEQVAAHPGRVTIVEIGPCMNLAAAVRRAPETAISAKRAAYMGGAFFHEGNVTPAAEFNFWFDPEAAKTALHAPFAEQIIVPLDACEKIRLTAERWRETGEVLQNPILREMWRRSPRTEKFRRNPAHVSYVWDTITAALVIDPSIVTDEISLPVDVNDMWSLSYGQSLAFRGRAPEGARTARIVLAVDEGRLWEMIFETLKGI